MNVSMNINVKKAKSLTLEALDKITIIKNVIPVIEDVIKDSCHNGNFFARYYLKDDKEINIAWDLSRVLEDYGFKVELENDENNMNIESLCIEWG